MAVRRWAVWGAALVAVIMLVSSLGLAAGGAGAPASVHAGALANPPAAHPAAASGPVAPSLASHATVPSTPAPRTTAPVSDSGLPYGIAQAESQIHAGLVSPSAVLLPRAPSASGIPAPGSPITGPSYPSVPAPMGLADFGQGAHGPYEYNSTSFAATLNLTSFTDYNPGYSGWGAGPDWMTFQLNTVTVNTSYPGATNGSFWIQNVVHFNGTSLQFEDNIWNFSSRAACLGAGTLLSYFGQQSGCFYYVYGPTFQVTYPMVMTLYNNLTIFNDSGRMVPGVYFNYSLTFNGTTHAGDFDFVTFNGNATAAAPPEFQVNGFTYNPLGYLFYDAEIIFGGNGGGANAMIANLSGTATLQYLPGGSTRYRSVPSAYDYGGDTGETAEGIAATWTNTTETLTQGPSFLYGLWNTTNGTFGPHAPSATVTPTFNGLPSYGFVFAANSTQVALNGTNGANWSYWPTEANGTATTVLPDFGSSTSYTAMFLANGFDPATLSFGASGVITPALTANYSAFDTPVYLSSDAAVTGYAASGVSGITFNPFTFPTPTLTIADVQSFVLPQFNRLNDFLYPTFMLFAALNLSYSVVVNNFTQAASTFNYTSDGHGGGVIPGWTQGYFFNFGTGSFEVSNVSVIGNSTLYYADGIEPLPSVEFWQTVGSNASYIVTGGDSFGVDVYNGNYTSLYQIQGETGANAIAVLDSSYTFATAISSNGTDIRGTPTWAAYLDLSTDTQIYGLTAQNHSLGSYAVYASYLYVTEATALSGATLFEGIYVDYATLSGLTATNGAWLGYLEEGTSISASNVLVENANGLGLYFDALSTVTNVTAQGQFSTGISELYDDTSTVLSGLYASNGAEGALAVQSTWINVTSVVANSGSYGIEVLSSQRVSVINTSAEGGSVGLFSQDGLSTAIAWVNATGSSLGLALQNNDWTNVSYLNSSNPVGGGSGPSYFLPAAGGMFPVAGIFTLGDQNLSISSGAFLNYPFGIVANDTAHLLIQDVSQWNGVNGLSLDGNRFTTVTSDFFYGDALGVSGTALNYTDVFSSTVEGSTSYAISLNGENNTVVVGNNFVANNGATTNGSYDAAHGQIGLANYQTGAFASTWIDNYWSDWLPANGAYPVATNISDAFPAPAFISSWLEVNETGLPVGTSWGFFLDGVSYGTTAPLVFVPSSFLPVATLRYSVIAPLGYTATPSSGSVSFNGTDLAVTISFAPIPYTVTFNESGLPAGSAWSVRLGNQTGQNTGSSIAFTAYEGSYTFSVPNVGNYVANMSTGTVVIAGASVTVRLSFSEPSYSVAFTQSTLPSGQRWSVTLNGVTTASTGSQVLFTVPNGTYSYSVGAVAGYTAAPSSGMLTVAGPTALVVTFTAIPPATYSVVFTESGLPVGKNWSVTLNGVTEHSTTANVVFSETNGTYSYSIGPIAGYNVTPTTGSVSVSGAQVHETVTFTPRPVSYTVTFTESGLPSGTSWNVTFDGTTRTVSGSSTTFSVENGTYAYSIGAPSGYTVSAESASSPLTVAGAAESVAVTFAAQTTPSQPAHSSGGLSSLDWIIIGALIVLVVIGAIAAVVLRGRRGGGARPASTTSSGPSEPHAETGSEPPQ